MLNITLLVFFRYIIILDSHLVHVFLHTSFVLNVLNVYVYVCICPLYEINKCKCSLA